MLACRRDAITYIKTGSGYVSSSAELTEHFVEFADTANIVKENLSGPKQRPYLQSVVVDLISPWISPHYLDCSNEVDEEEDPNELFGFLHGEEEQGNHCKE